MDVFDELERCIESCDPYLAHLLKCFRKEEFNGTPCQEDTMRKYLIGDFARLAVCLIDPQKQGLSGPEATATLRKLLEAKDCALMAMMP